MYFVLLPSELVGVSDAGDVLSIVSFRTSGYSRSCPSKQVSVCDIVDLLSVLLPSELVDVCVVGEDFDNPSKLCLRC